MALRFNGQVYLFELKVVERAPDGGALVQGAGWVSLRSTHPAALGDKGYAEGAGWVSLRSTHPAAFEDKGYADRHRGSGQPIHLIGVEFSREQRRVVGFDVETPGG
jgi:hypothetical protein